MDDPHADTDIAPLSQAVVVGALGCFWIVFVALNTLRAVLLEYKDPLGAFERRLLVAAVGVALSWAMYRLLVRLRPASSLRAGIALVSAMSLPAALVFSTVNFLAFQMLMPMAGDGCHAGPCTMHDLVVEVSDMLINWAFVFGAWGLLYLSLASAARARVADARSSADREAARLAQIRALRYQVNPHFLFNVLNSLTALVSRGDTAEAEALIGEIGSFLRHGLATDPIADTPLSDEVAMQQRYLELERRRFPTRLSIRIEVAADAARAAVPPLILQPLIENAVKHGVGRTHRPVLVIIAASRIAGDRLSLIVEDDARQPTAAEPAPSPDGFGVGLRNVRQRLAARFGEEAQFVAGPIATGGFRAAIIMPLIAI